MGAAPYIVYAYAQSVARAGQASKHWHSVCGETLKEPYRFIAFL